MLRCMKLQLNASMQPLQRLDFFFVTTPILFGSNKRNAIMNGLSNTENNTAVTNTQIVSPTFVSKDDAKFTDSYQFVLDCLKRDNAAPQTSTILV